MSRLIWIVSAQWMMTLKTTSMMMTMRARRCALRQHPHQWQHLLLLLCRRLLQPRRQLLRQRPDHSLEKLLLQLHPLLPRLLQLL